MEKRTEQYTSCNKRAGQQLIGCRPALSLRCVCGQRFFKKATYQARKASSITAASTTDRISLARSTESRSLVMGTYLSSEWVLLF